MSEPKPVIVAYGSIGPTFGDEWQIIIGIEQQDRGEYEWRI